MDEKKIITVENLRQFKDLYDVEIADGLLAKENTANKVTTITGESTDGQYPSAKAVRTYVEDNTIDETVDNLVNYTLKTETGSSIDLSINSSTYVMTLNLKDISGNTISTDSVDLPLESMVVSATYDSGTKEIVLTLQSGATTRFSVADLVSGLVSTTELEEALANKQDTLTAGDNITIENNVISANIDKTYTVTYGATDSETIAKWQEIYDIVSTKTGVPEIKLIYGNETYMLLSTEYVGKFYSFIRLGNHMSTAASSKVIFYRFLDVALQVTNDIVTTLTYKEVQKYFPTVDGVLLKDNDVAYAPTVDSYNPATAKYAESMLNAVASAYDAASTYSKGDRVSYQGKIYECSTDISTAEAWDSSHWTETTIDEAMDVEVIRILHADSQETKIAKCQKVYDHYINNEPCEVYVYSHVKNNDYCSFPASLIYHNSQYQIVGYGNMYNDNGEGKRVEGTSISLTINNDVVTSISVNSIWDILTTSYNGSGFGALTANNTRSFTPTGDYNPATKKYVDEQAEAVRVQYSTMPIASADNLGKIVQYTGVDTQDYTQGHFYIVVSDGADPVTYSWGEVSLSGEESYYTLIPRASGSETLFTSESDAAYQVMLKAINNYLQGVMPALYLPGYGLIEKWNVQILTNYTQIQFMCANLTGDHPSTETINGIKYAKINRAFAIYISKSEWEAGVVTHLYGDSSLSSTTVRLYWSNPYIIPTNNYTNMPLSASSTFAYTPTSDYNPAHKKYVDDTSLATVVADKLTGTTAPTTATVGYVGQQYTDTTNNNQYVCTAIDDTDPQVIEYTWVQVNSEGSGGLQVLQGTIDIRDLDTGEYIVLRGSTLGQETVPNTNDWVLYVFKDNYFASPYWRVIVLKNNGSNVTVNYGFIDSGSPNILYSMSGKSLTTFLTTDNTSSYNVRNDYNPAHKKYVDDNVLSVKVQYSTMPTANADNLGKIVQYIGTTTTTAPIYTNGHFYVCVSDGEETPTYSWEEISMMDSPTILTTNELYADDLEYGKIYYLDATNFWVTLRHSHEFPNTFKYINGKSFIFVNYVNNSSYFTKTLFALSQPSGNFPSLSLTSISVGMISTTPYMYEAFNNDGIVTSNTLNNYLAKTNTASFTPTGDYNPATKKYVDDAVGAIVGMSYEVVSSLPATGENGKIYLVANSGSGQNIYDEYIWISGDPTGSFEKIGTTDINLSNYYTKTEADAEFTTSAEVNTLITNAITSENLVTDANYVHTDNNYTTAEKTKLAGVEAGAEVNAIEIIKVNGTALVPDANKAVDITINTANPTNADIDGLFA